MLLDRTAARALVDAGYMPLSKYIEMFGDDIAADAPRTETIDVGHYRTRPWPVRAHIGPPGA